MSMGITCVVKSTRPDYDSSAAGDDGFIPIHSRARSHGQRRRKVPSGMHSVLKNGNIVLMASDNLGSGSIIKGNQFSMTIECSKKEADAYYANLSAGGKATHPMEDVFFGYYGDLTDKFGINWMISHMKPQP